MYYVKPGEYNEELRYSLRSLSNIPHDKVWIIGDKPSWVTNVNFVPGNRRGERWWNAFDNVKLAANSGIAEQTLMFNDDFFVMNPVGTVPVGWLSIFKAPPKNDSPRRESLRYTERFLASHGIKPMKLYTSHTPLPVEASKLAELMNSIDENIEWPPTWRSLYGNYWQIGGTRIDDVKILSNKQEWSGTDFVSTSDVAFKHGAVGQQIRDRFPNKSRYERS